MADILRNMKAAAAAIDIPPARAPEPIGVADLEAIVFARLVREHGGQKRDWRRAVGPVRLYDLATHPHCNWRVDPSGTISQNRAVEELCDDLRTQYPIVVI